jgi:hypothetical protein
MMKTADIYIFKHAFSNNLIIIELELQKAKMKLRQSFWLVYFNKVADCKQYGGIYLPSLRKHNSSLYIFSIICISSLHSLNAKHSFVYKSSISNMNRKWKVGHVILWNVTENGRPAVKERYPNNFQTPPFYSNKQSKLNGVSQRLYTIHLLSCYIVTFP